MLEKAPKVRGFKEKHDYVSEDEYLTFEEADRFVRAAAAEWRTFLVVALNTGLRVGERALNAYRSCSASPTMMPSGPRT